MSEDRYFLGIDHAEPKGVAVVMQVDGQKIGVVRAFELKGPTRPVYQLEDGIYEIPGRVVTQIPLKSMQINEQWLRGQVLDAEYNQSTPRKTWPTPRRGH